MVDTFMVSTCRFSTSNSYVKGFLCMCLLIQHGKGKLVNMELMGQDVFTSVVWSNCP